MLKRLRNLPDPNRLFPGYAWSKRLSDPGDQITSTTELDAERGTKPASIKDYERLTADDPTDGEG